MPRSFARRSHRTRSGVVKSMVKSMGQGWVVDEVLRQKRMAGAAGTRGNRHRSLHETAMGGTFGYSSVISLLVPNDVNDGELEPGKKVLSNNTLDKAVPSPCAS